MTAPLLYPTRAETVKRASAAQPVPETILRTDDLQVRVTRDARLVKQLVSQWHRTLPAPVGWKVAFVLTDGHLIYGVSTFGRPVARLEDQHATLEHTRMALSPAAPRNSASYFMAQSRRWIRENMPEIKRLISYVSSDIYTGVTYRSDNWKTVYANKKSWHKWTNRAYRSAAACRFRTKFERIP